MENKILALLQKTEEKHAVKIHYACESGSRAWGFPSPDSDYDFRFLYQHQRNWYLSVLEKTDNLTVNPEPLLDGSGWDIRKALRLLYKSNASIFEWLNSPIVYIENEEFVSEFRTLSAQYFLPRKVVFHYLGIAKGMVMKEMQGERVKIKKYFYVLRPILAAYWVGKKQAVPPMEFTKLLTLVENEKVLSALDKLIKEKETAKEGQLIFRNTVLDNFIEETMEECEEMVDSLPKKENDVAAIDIFYRKLLEIT